jgi:hypothetical protein
LKSESGSLVRADFLRAEGRRWHRESFGDGWRSLLRDKRKKGGKKERSHDKCRIMKVI